VVLRQVSGGSLLLYLGRGFPLKRNFRG
jgi:hypothetical protein